MSENLNNTGREFAQAADVLAGSFLKGLLPEPIHLTVSQWADEYRYLSSKSSAEPGRWSTARTPYLREPMDSLSPQDPCETVVLLFGSQLGKTETGLNWTGAIIDLAPGPMLMVQPTDKMSDKVVKQRLDPAIADTPRLAAKVSTKKSRDGNNSMESKDFPGGMLMMSGANSSSNLASMPIRYLFMDEVDRYPLDVNEEGDPVRLARARTRTFGSNKKELITSTPTIEGVSRVQSEYDLSDQRQFYVPCPHCDHYQTLKFKNLIFEKDNVKRDPGELPEDVRYQCEECGVLIEEHYKTKMLSRGEWRAKKPHIKRRKGYFLNSLYSPLGWLSWAQIAGDFLDAILPGKTTELKTFVNTILAETWKEKGDAPDWEKLYRRRSNYDFGTCPSGVLFLTAGVDIQRERIEMEIIGWGRDKKSWSIDYVVIPGKTTDPEVWAQLWAFLEMTWPVEGSKRQIRIERMAVDSSDQTQMVYNQVRKQDSSRVMAIKGNDTQSLPVAPPKPMDIDFNGQKIARGVMLWPVGVSIVKEEIYSWLRLESPLEAGDRYPAGWCEFPQYKKEYFRQLTAEEKVKRIVRGRIRYAWEVKYERNEGLDCRVYGRAAAYVFGLDRFQEEQFKQLESRLAENPEITHNTKKNNRKKGKVNPFTNKEV